jgi:site-specific DNA-methyltransferase (adenine-specific)
MAVRIEDAGFEIRDMIAWVYGSGFPKSLDVSKAIDKAAGAEREVVGSKLGMPGYHLSGHDRGEAFGVGLSSSTYETRLASSQITAPATEAAKQWAGWGTALKPSLEPITVARKPLTGTVAENVLQHGTGALNVDGCRVGDNPGYKYRADANGTTFHGQQGERIRQSAEKKGGEFIESTTGRFPANLIHDGSEEVVGLFPETGASNLRPPTGKPKYTGSDRDSNAMKASTTLDTTLRGHNDAGGSAARFFYCAKADSSERRNSKHPTIKPVALMRYLVRLVTPPGGLVLDPFGGSGTTAEAARLEHCRFLLLELSEEYCADAAERLRQGVLF